MLIYNHNKTDKIILVFILFIKNLKPDFSKAIYHTEITYIICIGYCYNKNMYFVGKRWNTASAYLRPALSRPNLSAEVGTLVTKVLFEGTKAIGIEYIKNGEKKKVWHSFFNSEKQINQ